MRKITLSVGFDPVMLHTVLQLTEQLNLPSAGAFVRLAVEREIDRIDAEGLEIAKGKKPRGKNAN